MILIAPLTCIIWFMNEYVHCINNIYITSVNRCVWNKIIITPFAESHCLLSTLLRVCLAIFSLNWSQGELFYVPIYGRRKWASGSFSDFSICTLLVTRSGFWTKPSKSRLYVLNCNASCIAQRPKHFFIDS